MTCNSGEDCPIPPKLLFACIGWFWRIKPAHLVVAVALSIVSPSLLEGQRNTILFTYISLCLALLISLLLLQFSGQIVICSTLFYCLLTCFDLNNDRRKEANAARKGPPVRHHIVGEGESNLQITAQFVCVLNCTAHAKQSHPQFCIFNAHICSILYL